LPTLNKDELIAKDIKLKVYRKQINVGDVVTERGIAAEYGVSRGTARAALEMLVREGIAAVRQTRGYVLLSRDYDLLLTDGVQLSENYGFPRLKKVVPSVLSETIVDSTMTQSLRLPLGSSINQVDEFLSPDGTDNDAVFLRLFFPDFTDLNVETMLTQEDSVLIQVMQFHHQRIYDVKSQISVESNVSPEIAAHVHGEYIVLRQWNATTKDGQVLALGNEYRSINNGAFIKPEPIIYGKVGDFIG
jgi:DNA-binding GntR family transcriptional regulator